LAGLVSVEEPGGSIFLRFGVVATAVNSGSAAASVLSTVERFFQSVIWRAGVLV
jgi:hypothetical protein